MEDFFGLCLAILLDLKKMEDFWGALYRSSNCWKNWRILGGALGWAALFQLASASASGALENFCERERRSFFLLHTEGSNTIVTNAPAS